ncbi:NucA/NucB deoxyribonuclease domain-containing protein [Streptomyces griseoaurantiacus]|uniref:NucA/NucB deoxyribonuclease domain-containing protein n=1 Tax=Streptomyces griseoaurantiacus TaxID=68213 RepID=UPI00345FCB4B
MAVRKYWMRAAVTAFVVMASAGVVATPTAQAEDVGIAHGRLLGSLPAEDVDTANDSDTGVTSELRSRGGSCADSPAAARAVAEKSAYTCSELTRGPVPATMRTPTVSSVNAESGTTCTTKMNNIHMDRMAYCGLAQITARNWSKEGELVGTAVMRVSFTGVLKPDSGVWEEEDSLTVTEITGPSPEWAVTWTAKCTSGCTATTPRPWAAARPMTKGQTVTGTVTYSDVPAPDGLDRTRPGAFVDAVPPNSTVIDSAQWSLAHDIRCDSYVERKNPGCAVPDVTPHVEFSKAEQQAAAESYLWARNNLTSHPGETSFMYSNNGKANRKRTCEEQSSVPFVPIPAVVDDSCDEYPFASTYQGGTDGGLCAEIVPQLENGTWKFYQADDSRPVTFNEPCIRSHVPSRQNKSAGGVLGNVVKNQRIIDTDKFTIGFVA